MIPPGSDGTVFAVEGPDVEKIADRFQERVDALAGTGVHVWIANAAYGVSEERAQRVLAGDPEPLVLDRENLVVLAIGCYACEEPLTRRTAARRCRPVP